MYVFIFFFCFCPRIVTVALALSFLLHFPVMRGITLQVGALEDMLPLLLCFFSSFQIQSLMLMTCGPVGMGRWIHREYELILIGA